MDSKNTRGCDNQGRRKHSKIGGPCIQGHPHVQKWKLKRGTLHAKFAKKWGGTCTLCTRGSYGHGDDCRATRVKLKVLSNMNIGLCRGFL